MLAEITIRNFAIIDRLDVEFDTGMTVLSGETGAGKSILVDALNLILGDRADAQAVREGAERAEVSARFVLDDAPAAREWLAEHELDDDNECLIRRVVASEGRSRCWINGAPPALSPSTSHREPSAVCGSPAPLNKHHSITKRTRHECSKAS